MKKIFSVALLVISVLISGCGNGDNAEDYVSSLKDGYTANVSVDEDGTAYTVRISKDDDGSVDMVFAEPSVLWGMGYSFEGDDSFLIYNDMNIELDQKVTEASTGGVYRWYELLKCDGEFTVSEDSVNGEKAVKLTNSNCDIYFDKEKKKPLMLRSGKTVITFDEWNGKNTDAQTTDVSTN